MRKKKKSRKQTSAQSSVDHPYVIHEAKKSLFSGLTPYLRGPKLLRKKSKSKTKRH